MRDASGSTQGFLLTCEDVTGKRTQEWKIKSTQRELSLALNAGKLVSWNYQVKEGLFYKFDDRIENIEKRSLEFVYESIHPDGRSRFSVLLDVIVQKQELAGDSIVLRVFEEQYKNYRFYNFSTVPGRTIRVM